VHLGLRIDHFKKNIAAKRYYFRKTPNRV